jgi:hypothetical protein
MTSFWRRLVALPMAYSVCVAVCEAGQGDRLLADIHAAWQARQEKFQTGRIVWDQNEHYDKNALPYFPSPGQARTTSDLHQAADVVTRGEFVFDGRKCRFQQSGPRWNEQQRRFEEQTETETFDGREFRRCREYSLPDTRPFGSFNKRTDGMGIQGIGSYFEPLALAFRPLSPEFTSVRLADYTVRAVSDQVRGIPCVCLHSKQVDIEQLLWLDPRREYVLVRHDIIALRGRLLMRYDIDYDDSPDVLPRA